MASISVSFRVDFGSACSVGPGKIALLEHIDSTGSLSQAARLLKMSYRRAWLLLEDLNTAFQQPVARMSVGGRGGGGACLTPFGIELVSAYRHLESQIHKRAQSAFPPQTLPAAKEELGRKTVPRRRINRSLGPPSPTPRVKR